MKESQGQSGERKRCGSCAFADLLSHGSVECRRFPPQAYFEPTGSVSNIRPRVGQEYWCGEFTRSEREMVDLADWGRKMTEAGVRSRIVCALHEHSPQFIAEGTDLAVIADDIILCLTADGAIRIAPPTSTESTEEMGK